MAKTTESMRHRKAHPAEVVAVADDKTAEAAAWANVSGIVQTALAFWNAFIGLQSNDNPLDPNGTGIAQLTCIVRAVSWVESQHGTGTGASASVDPMQCGNPGDSWWQELTDCTQLPQDRFVFGPGKPNFNACQLPAAAAASTGPVFPPVAYLSSLTNQTNGHNDPNFNQTMSYCWGIPILIHKINTTAGDKTFQCGDLNRDRLVEGAVAYNGGGVADYRTRINNALDMIGCIQTGPITRPGFEVDRRAANDTVVSIIQEVVRQLNPGEDPTKASKFFPHGIELIDVNVQFGDIHIEVKIAGAKAQNT